MTKLKILHLIKSLGRGGAEMLLPETLRVHDREAFEFAYAYFIPEKDQMVSWLEELDAKVLCFAANNSLSLLMQLPKVAQFAKDWEADIIHCHLPITGVLGRLIGKKIGVPIVYTEHNLQETYNPLTRFLNKATFSWQSKVIAVSDQVRLSIKRHHTRSTPEVKLLLNGVNTTRFDPIAFGKESLRGQLGINHECIVVGTVCVFRPQKQLLKWIDLAHKLWTEKATIHFILVGDGPDMAVVRQAVKKLGMDSNVHFIGRTEEVRPYLSCMDIYLMTSAYEGLPIALLEAMSMELPIVATAVGGIPEVIRHDKEGYLSKVENTDALFPFLSTLAQDTPKRSEMGKLARQRVKADFSIESMARSLESLYQQTLASERT